MFKNFVVFIDGDNISCRHYNTVVSFVKNHGEIFETRIFGLESKLNGWRKVAAQNFALLALLSSDAEEATDFYLDREATKMVMSNTTVNAYCIVSSDAHFCCIAEYLKAQGKYVLGIGESKSSDKLRKSFDHFIELGNVADNGKVVDFGEDDAHELKNVVEQAFSQMRYTDEDGWVLVSALGDIIKKHFPRFSWAQYGGKALNVLEEHADELGLEIERNKNASRIRMKPVPILLLARASQVGEGEQNKTPVGMASTGVFPIFPVMGQTEGAFYARVYRTERGTGGCV